MGFSPFPAKVVKSRADLAACLAVLEPHERQAARTLADTLGVADWTDCPPLRRVVLMVAALRLTADLPPAMSPTGRLREACWALLGADPSSSRMAASIARALRRWQGTDEAADKKSTTSAA